MTTKTRKPRLPKNVDGRNTERAKEAEKALAYFMSLCGTDPEDALTDFLCNVQHLCDRKPKTYGTLEDAIRKADGHYQAETGNAPY
jgi:hypothetical protein